MELLDSAPGGATDWCLVRLINCANDVTQIEGRVPTATIKQVAAALTVSSSRGSIDNDGKICCIILFILCLKAYNYLLDVRSIVILTTNLAAVVCVCVCQCAKFDKFLPARSHFESKRSENFVRIAKFPYAAFGPLFAFHCPLFFTRNNDLEWKSSRFAAVVRRSVADKQLA